MHIFLLVKRALLYKRQRTPHVLNEKRDFGQIGWNWNMF